MKNLGQRLLLFFVAIPVLLLMIFFLPYFHHAAIELIVLIFCCGSALELSTFFIQSGTKIRKASFCTISLFIPLAFFISTFLGSFPNNTLLVLLAIIALILFAPISFSSEKRLPSALASSSAYAFALLYPGLFGGFITLIVSGQEQGTAAIISFAFMVLGNDCLAWLCGVTLGKRRHLVAASPNKSLAGFLGGLAGSCGGGLVVSEFFPKAFPVSPWQLLIFSFIVGCSVIIGDLFESALKRSVKIKDSGSMIPGRGGFLDSFDSILFAAPVFYAGILILGLFK